MSTSTGAPAALARSDGWKLLTKGTATKPAPMAPAQLDAMIQVRLPPSIFWSVMFLFTPVIRDRSSATREVNPEF